METKSTVMETKFVLMETKLTELETKFTVLAPKLVRLETKLTHFFAFFAPLRETY